MAAGLTNLDPIDVTGSPPSNPFSKPQTVELNQPDNVVSMNGGVQQVKNPDGSVTFDFSPKVAPSEDDKDDFYRNLADDIEEGELDRISAELLDGIQIDIQSRREWLDTGARGIELLGFKLEIPTGEATGEGISKVRHPLLADAVLRFQANARGELLPSGGPVKVRNDTTLGPKSPLQQTPPPQPPPQPPQMGHNGGPPMGGPGAAPPGPSAGGPPPQPPPTMAGGPPAPNQSPGMQNPALNAAGPQTAPAPGAPPPTGMMQPPAPAIPDGQNDPADEMAQALETDFNHYLTAVATEYVPDTDRMLFWVGARGQGFKKVYNCPLRNRPVSESVDAENLVVNNATTDLDNCGRITHIIKMRPSTLKRMQLVGAYRDIDLVSAPAYVPPTPVDQAKNEISGITPQAQKPQDAEHEIYECYCELDISGFEHKNKGKITGLAVPYVVTVHKESRKVLQVRRNWEEKDKLCIAKQYFVSFPFVNATGFYGIGLINILGNTTAALTAAWRECLDAGMFANFPGFVFQKQFGRQLTNNFRVSPGGGIGLDTGGMPINQAVMPLPYKDIGAAFAAFIQHMEEVGQRVGGAADISIGEGKQDAPVGTTLALIEQATKVMDAVHKRLHASQAKEFMLLKDRFKEDPEAFWRFNNHPAMPWKKSQFLKALNDCNLVPVADPNNPTSMHRIAKGAVIQALASAKPQLYDPIAVDVRTMRIAGIDPQGLFRPTPAAPPPDPGMIAAQAKMQANQMQQQAQMAQMQLKQQIQQMQSQDKAADRESRERVEQMKIVLERLKIIEERIIHGDQEQGGDHDALAKAAELIMQQHQHNSQLQHDQQSQHTQLAVDDAQHRRELEHERQMALLDHGTKVHIAGLNNEAKIEAVKARPKPTSKGN
jgi:hypothetical protein